MDFFYSTEPLRVGGLRVGELRRPSPPLPTLGRKLYRVQHPYSFTEYTPDEGFKTTNSSLEAGVRFSDWLNPEAVTRHLDWGTRSGPSTPFISLFDNLEKAQDRALFHLERGHDDKITEPHKRVFVAEIDTSEFTPHSCWTYVSGRHVRLEGWQHPSIATMLFSMTEIGRKFGIEPAMVQRSEWLALQGIPAELMSVFYIYPFYLPVGSGTQWDHWLQRYGSALSNSRFRFKDVVGTRMSLLLGYSSDPWFSIHG